MYRYNPNALYHPNHGTFKQQMSIKDFVQQEIVVDQQGGSFEVEFPDIFVEYIMKEAPEKRVDTWQNQPFHFWQTQLDFAVWCATSAGGISVEHLNSRISMVRSIYRFHTYYQIRKILKELRVALPFQSDFNKYNNRYDETRYNKLIAEYYNLSTTDQSWRNQFFFSSYQGSKLVYLNSDSWSRWILDKSKGLTRVGIKKLSESIRAYAYLILYAQANARSSIVGNNSQAVDAQQIFLNSFEELINNQVSIVDDIKRFQNVLQHAMSKVDFSIAEGVYMIPSDLKLRIKKIEFFNNKILVSKPGFKIGINNHVNLTPTPLLKHEKKKPTPHHNQVKQHEHEQRQEKNDDGKLSKKERLFAKQHEDDKVALIFLISSAALGWYFSR